jgi:TRAP-type C4-dicarboxylate transport system permease large subunit
MHANIGSCAMFAATSGSSVATAATIGTVALPEIQKRKYDEPLFLGTIAAGGTLGILIPPSINFILYGLLTNSSVPRLYLAGFIPGFMLAFFFMLIVLGACLINPLKGGMPIDTTWARRLRVLPSVIPTPCIFLVVVGSI